MISQSALQRLLRGCSELVSSVTSYTVGIVTAWKTKAVQVHCRLTLTISKLCSKRILCMQEEYSPVVHHQNERVPSFCQAALGRETSLPGVCACLPGSYFSCGIVTRFSVKQAMPSDPLKYHCWPTNISRTWTLTNRPRSGDPLRLILLRAGPYRRQPLQRPGLKKVSELFPDWQSVNTSHLCHSDLVLLCLAALLVTVSSRFPLGLLLVSLLCSTR